jgi:L-gulonolactone oxidase
MVAYRIDQLEPELQKIAVDSFTFQNWAKTFRCKPELLFTPTTETQVQKVKVYQMITANVFFYLFVYKK